MNTLSDLVATYGYWIVAATIAVESMGIPVPGETMLLSAAIYAGATEKLSITLVIVWASVGAILGDNVGFLIGRRYGYPLLLRHGHLVNITVPRIKLGQYLFQRHGGKVVFLGRFIALLRALAAVLAGTNGMPWGRFLFFNAAGAVTWAGVYGTAAYLLGQKVEQFSRPVGIALVLVAAVGAIGFITFVRRHEAALEAEAERALPGPLRPVQRR